MLIDSAILNHAVTVMRIVAVVLAKITMQAKIESNHACDRKEDWFRLQIILTVQVLTRLPSNDP